MSKGVGGRSGFYTLLQWMLKYASKLMQDYWRDTGTTKEFWTVTSYRDELL